nr:MAG TPA: hypothetical protein [Caudoviricetes sp.]
MPTIPPSLSICFSYLSSAVWKCVVVQCCYS